MSLDGADVEELVTELGEEPELQAARKAPAITNPTASGKVRGRVSAPYKELPVER